MSAVTRVTVVLAAVWVLTACAAFATEPAWKKAVAGDGPGDPSLLVEQQITVEDLPRSRSGNRSEYEVFGNRYQVLDSALGFQEEGIASWYGAKFHGRATASGEIYDMHQLTAAHKHLPLPTFVRVTRLDNGRSLIVKVNDRGPFVGDRIIDLSYAAAAQLDMLENGKAAVRIEALSAAMPAEVETLSPGRVATPYFVQLGAFREQDNAQAMVLQAGKLTSSPVSIDFDVSKNLYQVRVGPLSDADSVQATLNTLSMSGLPGYLVTPSL